MTADALQSAKPSWHTEPDGIDVTPPHGHLAPRRRRLERAPELRWSAPRTRSSRRGLHVVRLQPARRRATVDGLGVTSLYHAGLTDDPQARAGVGFSRATRTCVDGLAIVGFSLGGNVALRARRASGGRPCPPSAVKAICTRSRRRSISTPLRARLEEPPQPSRTGCTSSASLVRPRGGSSSPELHPELTPATSRARSGACGPRSASTTTPGHRADARLLPRVEDYYVHAQLRPRPYARHAIEIPTLMHPRGGRPDGASWRALRRRGSGRCLAVRVRSGDQQARWPRRLVRRRGREGLWVRHLGAHDARSISFARRPEAVAFSPRPSPRRLRPLCSPAGRGRRSRAPRRRLRAESHWSSVIFEPFSSRKHPVPQVPEPMTSPG